MPSADRPLRPADLARVGGVSPQTVRRYEQWGVLPVAGRTAQGYRRYTRAHMLAMVTARAVIAGYGRHAGLRVMQLVHAGRFTEAFRLADERHSDLHVRHLEATAALAAMHGLAGTQPMSGWTQPIQIGNVGAPVGTAPAVPGTGAPAWDHRIDAIGASLAATASTRFGEGFSIFDQAQLRRARAVAVLASSASSSAGVVDSASGLGAPGTVLGSDEATAAAAARLATVDAESRRCAGATSVLFRYVRALERAAAPKRRAAPVDEVPPDAEHDRIG